MKTYLVMVNEKVTWDVEVEANSHKEAGEIAIHKVSHNDYGKFPQVGRLWYSICSSVIKGRHFANEKKDDD